MKIKIIIVVFLLIILSSCAKINIVTDPYWVNLVSDFQGNAFNLKVQSLLNGFILNIVIGNTKGIIPDSIGKLKSDKKNIIILSPLLSKQIDTVTQNTKNIVYYFTENQGKGVSGSPYAEGITRDRRQAFFDTGILLGGKLSEHSLLPVIYTPDDNLQRGDVESFLDGIKTVGKDISIIYLRVSSQSSEEDIREFYDQVNKKNIKFIVVFSLEFKYLSYNLAEKYGMQLITSDSWYGNSHRSLILYSIEDDIKGMLKKVYSNAKTGKHRGILLEGLIRK